MATLTYHASNALRHYAVGLCATAAIAIPLYLRFGPLDWVVTSFGWIRGGPADRPTPPNLDTAVGWAMWFTQAGAMSGAIVVAVLAVAYCFEPDRRARLSATIARCLLGELLWVAASLLAITTVINGLLTT